MLNVKHPERQSSRRYPPFKVTTYFEMEMVLFRQTMLPFYNPVPYHIMKQLFITNDVSYLQVKRVKIPFPGPQSLKSKWDF